MLTQGICHSLLAAIRNYWAVPRAGMRGGDAGRRSPRSPSFCVAAVRGAPSLVHINYESARVKSFTFCRVLGRGERQERGAGGAGRAPTLGALKAAAPSLSLALFDAIL